MATVDFPVDVLDTNPTFLVGGNANVGGGIPSKAPAGPGGLAVVAAADAVAVRSAAGLGTAAVAATGDFDAAGAAAAVLSSSLQKNSNLSELANAATARTNLGLGTAAVADTTDFDPAGSAAAAQAAAAGDATTKANTAQSNAILATQGVLRAHFNGYGTVPVAGSQGVIEVPYDCTITAATMLADASSAAVIDIWLAAVSGYPGNYPPTVATKITDVYPPTLAGAFTSKDIVLTNWTKNLNKGDILLFNLTSASVLTWVQLSLSIVRR